MSAGRSTAKDGLGNKLETYVTTHFRPAWSVAQRVPPVRRRLNRALINSAVLKVPTRPNPLSTLAPYTSWRSLTDKTFASRHLPPLPDGDADLPPPERVADLFMRSGDAPLCPKSTVLFQYFAQWFTDGFLRSDRSQPPDPRKTESNHEIDLMQLYGLTPGITQLLRTGEAGLLKSQMLNGEEYPPYLRENGKTKPEFEGLPPVVRYETLSEEQLDGLFAVGSDTSNSQAGFLMMNVLFLREHNRIARLLAEAYPRWDDERLFATARNILTVILLKIVVEEYINHIAPYYFKFFVDPQAFRNESWIRPNWMAIEFNLLYRWHSLVPSSLHIGGHEVSTLETLFNTEILVEHGLGQMFEDASNQRACRVGLLNTDPLLRDVEIASIRQGRAVGLMTYNDYRELCRFPRVTAFDQISGNPAVQDGLRDVYGTVDRIEFFPGLFAEDLRPNSVLPALVGRFVGIDAFSQALPNPLLAPRVFNERTFSAVGMDLIRTTRTLSDILHRNVPDQQRRFVSLTRRGWKRV